MRLVTKSQRILIEANYPANTTDMSTLTFFMGDIKMKTKKLVCGIGLNDADYSVAKFETIVCADGKKKNKQVWFCRYYRTWASMLNRCYSAKLQDRRPTYKNCTVSNDWLTFTNFKAWMEKQDWEGNQLDKDLLIEGNKIYSAETCVFVTRAVNSFTLDKGAARGEWLIGVSWNKLAKKFMSMCHNPFTKKLEYLGLFTSEQEAHEAWLKRKLELAHELAAIQSDQRVAKALIDGYSQYCV